MDLSAFEIGLCFKEHGAEPKGARHYLKDIQDARDMDVLLRICRKESGNAINADRVSEMYLSARTLYLDRNNSTGKKNGEQLLLELESAALLKMKDFSPRQVN